MQGGWAHYPHLKSASTGGLARSSSLDRTSREDAAANERRAETNSLALPSVYPLSMSYRWPSRDLLDGSRRPPTRRYDQTAAV